MFFADKAAKEAVIEASTLPKSLTELYTDVCGYIKEAICPKWQRAWNRSSSGRSLFQHIPTLPKGSTNPHYPRIKKQDSLGPKQGITSLRCICTSLILLTLICVTVVWICRTLNMLSCIAPFTRLIVMK